MTKDKDFSIPIHATENLFLRFLANYIFSPISSFFLNLYLRWGTTYALYDLDNLGGKGWDDYDEFGHPYWDYLWHEDAETGDGWRLVNKDWHVK
jgi:hypothetical protein